MHHTISEPLRRLLESELRPGERVVWSQQPRLLAIALRALPKFLFGLGFCAFGAFLFSDMWRTTTSSKPTDSAFIWFPGSIFILIASYQVLRPLWTFGKAFRTVYAITDQRAVLIVGAGRRTVYSFVDQNLMNIHRVENRSGNGDIIFHRELLEGGGRRGFYYDVGFLGITRVREAEDALRVLFEKTRKA